MAKLSRGRVARALRTFAQYLFPPRQITFPADGYEFVVATTAGLFLCWPNLCQKILSGQIYGVTFTANELCYFEAFPRLSQGRVRAIDKSGRSRTLISDLSPGCHQIEYWNGNLYILDTYNNAVLCYDARTWRKSGTFYPCGALSAGRASENYAHLNSILFCNGRVFLLCHNETTKTGKSSELLTCDAAFNILERRTLDAGNAHNIAAFGEDFIICDSNGGRIIGGNKTYASSRGFLRGLSVSSTRVVVGASDIADRSERADHNGEVLVYDHNWNPLAQMPVAGMVHEIRAFWRPDFGLSTYLR
jgi:hypothetical protein